MTGHKMDMNKKKLSKYLDQHDYPALFYRFPLLVRLNYAVNFIMTLRNWYVRRTLKNEAKKLPEGFLFLDAGFGMGEFAIGIAKRYPHSKITGIDFMESNRKLAEHTAKSMHLENTEFFKGDLTDLNGTNKYDLVLCSSTLQFIEKDNKVLENIAASMKTNGKLILYVPVVYKRYFPWSEKLENKYLTDYFYRYHEEFLMHRYGEDEVIENVGKQGLKISDCRKAYGILGTIAFELYMLILAVMKRMPLIIAAPAVIFYVLTVFPVQMLMMLLDYMLPKSACNGLLITAEKK